MLHKNAARKKLGPTISFAQLARCMRAAIIICLAFSLLTGCIHYFCQEASKPRPASPDKTALVDKSFITDQPCEPPCWQNRVPGVSTGDQVVATLGKLPFVEATSITRQKYQSSNEGELVTWESSLSEGSYGFMRLDRSAVLISIDVMLEYDLTVEEVIDQRGDPEFFTITPDGPNCGEVFLHWFKSGFGLGTVLCMAAEDGQLLTPETLISAVRYFPAVNSVEDYWRVAMFYLPEEDRKPSERYFPWDGYESVDIDLVWKGREQSEH